MNLFETLTSFSDGIFSITSSAISGLHRSMITSDFSFSWALHSKNCSFELPIAFFKINA